MRNGSRVRGFTYVGLLIAVAVIAVAATRVLEVGAQSARRAAEAELLAIGAEFRRALESYAMATPLGMPTAPRELNELLRDPRHPGIRRHLRRIYVDPLTGQADWYLMRAPDGRIVGIHSASPTPTLRRSGFPAGMEGFATATHHDEWIFAVTPAPGG